MSDLLTQYLAERDAARAERDYYRAQAAEQERRAQDPLLSIYPPNYGDIDVIRRRHDMLEQARAVQTVELTPAPDIEPFRLQDGRLVRPVDPIVAGVDMSYATVTELVERGVLLRIPPEVAERRAASKNARYVVGDKGGLMTVSRGILDRGEAVHVSDFDRGPSETELLSEPERIGTDAEGRAVYQRTVLEVRRTTAEESRKAAERRFAELLELGYIIDRGPRGKGAA